MIGGKVWVAPANAISFFRAPEPLASISQSWESKVWSFPLTLWPPKGSWYVVRVVGHSATYGVKSRDHESEILSIFVEHTITRVRVPWSFFLVSTLSHQTLCRLPALMTHFYWSDYRHRKTASYPHWNMEPLEKYWLTTYRRGSVERGWAKNLCHTIPIEEIIS